MANDSTLQTEVKNRGGSIKDNYGGIEDYK